MKTIAEIKAEFAAADMSSYPALYEIYKEEMPFISLYNNVNFILYSRELKGDLSSNWYDVFYNIENWYKIK